LHFIHFLKKRLRNSLQGELGVRGRSPDRRGLRKVNQEMESTALHLTAWDSRVTQNTFHEIVVTSSQTWPKNQRWGLELTLVRLGMGIWEIGHSRGKVRSQLEILAGLGLGF
jgi:hypothetical protein